MGEQQKIDQLRQAIDELELINRIIGRLCRIGETNHIMSTIVDELVKYTEASQGVINLVSADNTDDMETVVRDTGSADLETVFRLDDLLAGWVLTHRQMLKIDDINNDDRFPTLSSPTGRFARLICFPMIVRGRIIGLTSLVRDREAEPFSDGQCRVVGIIVSQSAQILANSLLMKELARKNELLRASQQALRDENARLQLEITETFAFENIIGRSAAMKQVLTLASKVSTNDVPVLITGPTGTGKELVARAIHYNGPRREKPFVVKNCGIKTESLLESELFGHIKGAFTGADRDKIGLFREADGGTILLDEIGDAPLSTQIAILRVLENGEIRPVGSDRTEYVDVRVLSATNADLRKKIAAGEFREDLYYRLNTVGIDIPPLNRRADDIPTLVNYFIGKLEAKLGHEHLSVTPDALAALIRYDWPGNVRQLFNEIERAAVVCDADGIIDLTLLSRDIRNALANETEVQAEGALRRAVEEVERQMITEALTATGGNILQSSKTLGLTRKGLKDKLARYGIDPSQFSD